jgi:photosystem II stability/assembly factor-like uncharacterized protein
MDGGIGGLSPRGQRAAALIGLAIVAVVVTGLRYLGPSLAAAVSRPAAAAATPRAPRPAPALGSVSFVDARHGVVTMFDRGSAVISGEATYLTADGGRTWRPVPTDGRSFYQILYLDRGLLERYVVNGPLPAVQLSEDGGRSWRTVGNPRPLTGYGALPTFSSANDALWLDRANAPNGQPFAGAVGLWRTWDGGRTWTAQPLPSLPARSQIVSVALGGPIQELLVEREADGGWWLFATVDGGASWRRMIRLDTASPDEVTLSAFIERHGVQLVTVVEGVPGPVAQGITRIPSAAGSPSLSLYVAHSDDGGLTWSRLVAAPATASGSGPSRSVPVFDGHGDLVLLDRTRLWSSTDLGATWRARAAQMPEGAPPAALLSGVRDGSLFALAAQPGPIGQGGVPLAPARLLRSTDGGAHWEYVPLPGPKTAGP